MAAALTLESYPDLPRWQQIHNLSLDISHEQNAGKRRRRWLHLVMTCEALLVRHRLQQEFGGFLKRNVYNDQGSVYMAKTFVPFEFVDCRLLEADKATLKQLREQWQNDSFAAWEHMLSMGYKTSQVWDDGNNTLIFTVTGTPNSKHNQKKAMSSRSDDLHEAIFMSLYKIAVVFNGEDWTNERSTRDWG